MINKLLLFLITTLLFTSCSKSTLPPFSAADQPAAPDYTKESNWSALPFRTDAPDAIPKQETWIHDSLKNVDVFYVYPTLYRDGETWNADLANHKLNKKIDKYPVRLQASAFNRVARVYAPRYRQATVESFSDTTASGNLALQFAYADVKRAFEYYLLHYNNGRPIIIASHSQGTWHCRQLLKDFFDTPQMKQQLVCAYIVGYAIYPAQYKMLTPCKTPDETNCYVTWSTFKEGYNPRGKLSGKKTQAPLDILAGDICVNPVSWEIDSVCHTGTGGFLLNMNRKKPYRTDARNYDNVLWVKTKAPFAKRANTLHILDYNLFWHNIRSNAATRVENYLKQYSVK